MADDAPKIAHQDLYEQDYVAWAEDQAAALLARRVDALDFERLAEEVADLARTELRACRSYISRIIEHLLKLEFVNSPEDRRHWRGELVNFRGELEDDLTKTLVNQLQPELPKVFRRQLKALNSRGMIRDVNAVTAALGDGYSWEQIVDPDFYPEPRYA